MIVAVGIYKCTGVAINVVGVVVDVLINRIYLI